jgi:hypothetical protein
VIRGGLVGSVLLLTTTLVASASAPERSLRPMGRTFVQVPPIVEEQEAPRSPALQEAAVLVAVSEVATRVRNVRTRPVPRPSSTPEVIETEIEVVAQVAALQAVGPMTSIRPNVRPKAIEQQAFFGKKRKSRKGSVCGNADIKGEKVGRVPGKLNGCGVKDAVRVTSVSGVRLSRGAVMTCDTAQALNQWVERGVKPTFRNRGPVVEMRVAAHYSCRTRNNRRGAKISEHGKGKAIDISSFTMKDGEEITVLQGWKRGSSRRLLQRTWKAACGPFGTVLGPKADRYHQDHFHLDTARHRGGPYCR